ncbi:hypothetical protein TPA0907_56410 [Micromonospora humidisoli]|nr:hypothetical protein TPA0907_56410 [Micromonospora sp. AKA109]
MPQPDAAEATARTREVAGPVLDVGGDALELIGGSRLHLVIAALNRTGAVVLALLTAPAQAAPRTVGYLAWPLKEDRRIQTIIRKPAQAGCGIGITMWEYACLASELVDWIGHPQHHAKRTDDGEAFARRAGGTACCRCGRQVDVPKREIVNPGSGMDALSRALTFDLRGDDSTPADHEDSR